MQCSNDESVSQENHNHFPTKEKISKLPEDGGEEFNRLVFEQSPYLLQHASNPVDWYAWGEEAFKKAAEEDKPIFLSIGYSTCHWCHVMAHESFEDSTVAALMNAAFVNVKVDREERPDIDQIYMSVCQAMTGSGGWPMTIIMTPDKKPFFAGTYFPKESRAQRIGMLDLVPRMEQAWKSERSKIVNTTEQVLDFLRDSSSIPTGDELDASLLEKTYSQLASRFDPTEGGFGSAPKFPSPHNLTFLLRYWYRTGEAKALEMVETTLQKMRLGGIFDHVGFGFHRYSTDPVWLLPHFEKMLYDQALLVIAYIETYQATGKQEYADTANEILTYILRDMTSPEGGFYSAEDADSEGEEGLFYLWKPEEIISILGKKEGEFFTKLLNLEEGGNFHDQSTQQKTGDSIAHLKKSLTVLAGELETSAGTLELRWEKARTKLFEEREKRIHPFKDDKILTDWNGLMIAAFAKAAQVLNNDDYSAAAKKATDFVFSKLRKKNGNLLKRYRQGEAALPAHSDDYAFMTWGLLELYEATFETRYLESAIELNNILLNNFWDKENGGLYFTSEDLNDELIVRPKEVYDGAIPSGNSVAALNLMRLSRLTGDETLAAKAIAIGKAFSQQVQRAPMGHTQLMSALDFWSNQSFEVVIVGEPGREDAQAMLQKLNTPFIPNKVVLFRPDGEAEHAITKIAPFTKYQNSLNGKATAFVCKNFTCNAPTTDVEKMMGLLAKK